MAWKIGSIIADMKLDSSQFNAGMSSANASINSLTTQMAAAKAATASYAIEMARAKADVHAWAAEITRTKAVIADLYSQTVGDKPLIRGFKETEKSLEAAQNRLVKLSAGMVESKASVAALSSEMANAKGKTLALKDSLDKAKASTAGVSTGTESLWKGMLKTAGGFITAQAAIALFNKTLSITKDLIKGALKNIDDFKVSIITTAAMLTSLAADPSMKTFQQNIFYAKEMMEKLEKASAKFMSTGKEMQLIFGAFAIQGIIPVSDKDIHNLGLITDAIKVMRAGTISEQAALQEVFALLEGQVGVRNKLAMFINKQVGDLDPWIAKHREAGDLLEAIIGQLGGFANAQEVVLDLMSTWEATLKTIYAVITRAGFTGVYDDIINSMRKINNLLRDQKGELTPLAQEIVVKIKGAWETVKVPIVELLDILIKNAPLIVDTLATSLQVVAVAGTNALKVIIELSKWIQKAQVWYAGYQKDLAKGKLQKLMGQAFQTEEMQGLHDKEMAKQLRMYQDWGGAERIGKELDANTKKLMEEISKTPEIKFPLAGLLKPFLEKGDGGGGGAAGAKAEAEAIKIAQEKIERAVAKRYETTIKWADKGYKAETLGLEEVLAGYERARKYIAEYVANKSITVAEGEEYIKKINEEAIKKKAEEVEREKKIIDQTVKDRKAANKIILENERGKWAVERQEENEKFDNEIANINKSTLSHEKKLEAIEISTKAHNIVMKGITDDLVNYEIKKAEDAVDAIIKGYFDIEEKKLRKKEFQYENKEISKVDYTAYLQGELDALEENGMKFTEIWYNIHAKLKNINKSTVFDVQAVWTETLKSIYGSFESFFSDLFTGQFKTFTDAFRGLMESIQKTIAAYFAQLLTNKLLSWFFNQGGGGSAQNVGNVGSTIQRLILPGSILTAAQGTIVSKPTLAMIGEGTMKEAVIPMPGGAVPAIITDKSGGQPLELSIYNVLDPSFMSKFKTSAREIINVISGDIAMNGMTKRTIRSVI